MAKKADAGYGADSISVLEGLEAVRKRPGMYIGSVSRKGLNHLVYEIVDNAVDEHLAGACDTIHVTLEKDGSCTVEDNGRGVPVAMHEKGVSAARLVFSTLHLCMNLFLPYVLEYNKEVNGGKIAELLLPLAGPDIYAQTPGHLRADKAIATIQAMRDRIYALTKLPRTLSETGKVSEAQLDEVAEKALNDGSIIYNPKEATLEDLKTILKKAW